jgi:hypothetical protein
MKNLLLLATFLFSSVCVFSQDIIVTKKSERIDAKVLEINVNDVKYKDWSNQDGPIYTILKSDIASIIYQTGKVETFADAPKPSQPQQPYNNSQNYGSMTVSRFNAMNDDEQDKYLEKYVGGDIYDTFHSGVKLSRAGKALRTVGIIFTGAGLGLVIAGVIYDSENGGYSDDYYYDDYYDDTGVILYTVGAGFAGAGEVLIITSIPLSASGGAKKKTAQNEYVKYLNETSMNNYNPSLNFGFTTKGIGLVYKF